MQAPKKAIRQTKEMCAKTHMCILHIFLNVQFTARQRDKFHVQMTAKTRRASVTIGDQKGEPQADNGVIAKQ